MRGSDAPNVTQDRGEGRDADAAGDEDGDLGREDILGRGCGSRRCRGGGEGGADGCQCDVTRGGRKGTSRTAEGTCGCAPSVSLAINEPLGTCDGLRGGLTVDPERGHDLADRAALNLDEAAAAVLAAEAVRGQPGALERVVLLLARLGRRPRQVGRELGRRAEDRAERLGEVADLADVDRDVGVLAKSTIVVQVSACSGAEPILRRNAPLAQT